MTILLNTQKSDYTNIKELYFKAFPENERKPFFLLKKLVSAGKAEILKLETDNKFSGLVISLKFDNLVLIDYFAIDENLRGKGIGSEALILIKNRYKNKKVFLEIEKPGCGADDDYTRIRRKNFYLRNGLIDCGVSISIYKILMEILSFGEMVTYDDYIKLLRGALGESIFRILNPKREPEKCDL